MASGTIGRTESNYVFFIAQIKMVCPASFGYRLVAEYYPRRSVRGFWLFALDCGRWAGTDNVFKVEALGHYFWPVLRAVIQEAYNDRASDVRWGSEAKRFPLRELAGPAILWRRRWLESIRYRLQKMGREGFDLAVLRDKSAMRAASRQQPYE